MELSQDSDSYLPAIGETFSVASGDESQPPIPQKPDAKKSLTGDTSAESVVVSPNYQPNPLLAPVATRNVRWPSYTTSAPATPNVDEKFSVSASPNVGYASDIAKSVAGQGTLGATADVASLPRIFDPLIIKNDEELLPRSPELYVFSQVAKGLKNIFPYSQEEAIQKAKELLPFTQYEPQTIPGKLAGSAARVAGNVATTGGLGAISDAAQAPSAIEGALQIAKGIASKPVLAGAGAGLTSEGIGEGAEALGVSNSAQPYIRTAAALLGGYGSSKLIDAVHSLAAPTVAAREEVLKALTEDLKSDSTKLNQVQNAIDSGSDPTIYDMAGKRTMAVLKKYGYLNDDAKEKVNDLIQNLKARRDSASSNVVNHLESIFGKNLDAGSLEAAKIAENKLTNDNFYKIARTSPNAQTVWNDDLANMLNINDIKKADSAVRKIATDPELEINTFKKGTPDQIIPSSILDESGNPISSTTIKGVPDQLPNLNYWDQIKRKLGDDIDAARNSGKPDEATRLVNLKNKLLSNLDNAVPEYAQARNTAAEGFGEKDSISAGYNSIKKMDSFKNHEFVNNFNKMTDDQKRLFRLGAGSAIKDQINNGGIDSFLSMADKSDQAARMRMALGDDAYYSLLSKAKAESFLSKVKAPIQPEETAGVVRKSINQFGVPTTFLAASGIGHEFANLPMAAAAGAGGLAAASLVTRGITNFAESRIAPKVVELMSDPSRTQEFADLMRSNPAAVSVSKKIADEAKKALIYGQSAAPSQYTPESLRNYQEYQRQQSLLRPQATTPDTTPAAQPAPIATVPDKPEQPATSSTPSYDYNIGNIRRDNKPNSPFKKYDTAQDGIVDTINLLRKYPNWFNRGKDMSLLQIAEKFAPRKDGNDPVAWANGIAKIFNSDKTNDQKISVNQPLNLNQKDIWTKFIPALHKQERGAKKAYSSDVYSDAINKVFPEEQQPNPQRDVSVLFPPHGEASGGRIERKSGGRVDNIQPLVDELMRKFKQAKKVTDKTTEPLLNEPDDAIVKALKVAQDAI